MIGGMVKSASKKMMKTYQDQVGLMIVLSMTVLFLKTLLVQWSYNQVWPTLVKNTTSSGDTSEFTPLTFYQALLVVILFTFLT